MTSFVVKYQPQHVVHGGIGQAVHTTNPQIYYTSAEHTCTVAPGCLLWFVRHGPMAVHSICMYTSRVSDLEGEQPTS